VERFIGGSLLLSLGMDKDQNSFWRRRWRGDRGVASPWLVELLVRKRGAGVRVLSGGEKGGSGPFGEDWISLGLGGLEVIVHEEGYTVEYSGLSESLGLDFMA
jgi:hypothetical protein